MAGIFKYQETASQASSNVVEGETGEDCGRGRQEGPDRKGGQDSKGPAKDNVYKYERDTAKKGSRWGKVHRVRLKFLVKCPVLSGEMYPIL